MKGGKTVRTRSSGGLPQKWCFLDIKGLVLSQAFHGRDFMHKTGARSRQTHSQHQWGRGSQLPPLAEELSNGQWEGESIFFKLVTPDRMPKCWQMSLYIQQQPEVNVVALKRSI